MAEVEVTREGAVLTITLNRPDVLNALNRAVHAGIAAALEEAKDPSVRAVVITGAGRGFCVGQDLQEFSSGAGDVAQNLRDNYHRNVLAIRALEKPVIAAVNGAGGRRRACRSRSHATRASRPTRRASCRRSSRSVSSPTRAARGSCAGCSAPRAPSSG